MRQNIDKVERPTPSRMPYRKVDKGVCTGSMESQYFINKARDTAVSNGYTPLGPFTKGHNGNITRSRVFRDSRNKKGVLYPFLSDEVSKAVRLCLRRCDPDKLVSLEAIPPDTLKKQLVRNRINDQECGTLIV